MYRIGKKSVTLEDPESAFFGLQGWNVSKIEMNREECVATRLQFHYSWSSVEKYNFKMLVNQIYI